MAAAQLTDIFEFSDFTLLESAQKVDRTKGVIHGVKLLGWDSANGRRYVPEGVDPKLYEGRPINVNHTSRPGEQRSAYDRFGRTVNVTKRPDGVYGDIEYLKSHPMANQVTEAAERMPGLFGMSHHARGDENHQRGGQTTIEAVREVVSVDLVADPATTKGFYESRQRTMKTTVRAVLEAAFKGQDARLTALKELKEEAGMLDAPMDAPAVDSDADGQIDAAFEQMLMGVFRDKKADIKAKLKKAKEILTAQEKLLGGGKEEEKPAPTEESKKPTPANLQEQFDLRLKARDLCADAGLVPGKVLRKALDACTSEQEMAGLIEEAKGQQQSQGGGNRTGGSPPRSGGSPNGNGGGTNGNGTQSLTEGFDDSPEARAKRIARARGNA